MRTSSDKIRLTVSIASAIIIVFFSSQALAWTITADFEQGTSGQRAQGPSGLSEAFSQTLYSTENPNSGTKSAKVTWNAGSDGWGQSGGAFYYPTTLGEGNEIWFRFYNYFKAPWPTVTNSPFGFPKFVRPAHVTNQSGGNIGYHSLYINPSRVILLDSEIAGTQIPLNATVSIGVWESYEMYIKFSSTAGIVRVWKNGILVGERKDRTLRSSTDKVDLSYVLTWWNNGAPQTCYQYLDDFVVTTDRPAGQDAYGNYMIGPLASGPRPSPPSSLR